MMMMMTMSIVVMKKKKQNTMIIIIIIILKEMQHININTDDDWLQEITFYPFPPNWII